MEWEELKNIGAKILEDYIYSSKILSLKNQRQKTFYSISTPSKWPFGSLKSRSNLCWPKSYNFLCIKSVSLRKQWYPRNRSWSLLLS